MTKAEIKITKQDTDTVLLDAQLPGGTVHCRIDWSAPKPAPKIGQKIYPHPGRAGNDFPKFTDEYWELWRQLHQYIIQGFIPA